MAIDLEISTPWELMSAFLSDRKLLIILTRYSGQERFIKVSIIAGCQAESKALFISKKKDTT